MKCIKCDCEKVTVEHYNGTILTGDSIVESKRMKCPVCGHIWLLTEIINENTQAGDVLCG